MRARMALAARRGVAFDALDDVDDLEQEAARGDVGLGQFQPQSVAQPERLAGPLAYEHLAAFVVAEELLAERPDGISPSAPLASSAANRPKRVTLVTRPGKVAPTWAAMKAAT